MAAADAIIGNPPFHGDRHLRRVLGDGYVDWLETSFGIGVKDYCVYWFRKAHDVLAQGGRAGLVGTNSISQNRARAASLEYIVGNGGVITNAVSTQDWPGEAAVDVSIVNWVKRPVKCVHPMLDAAEVHAIGPDLRLAESKPERLAANRGFAFQGMLPGANFIADTAEAERLRADPWYRDVVRPYLGGDDIANDPRQRPSRFIVDFGLMALEEAMRYPMAELLVRAQAKDARESSRSYSRNPRWWQFLWPRPVFREKIASLDRFIAGSATGKRILFCWCAIDTCPSNSTNVFAFDRDEAIGVLTSCVHTSWARALSSTLEDRIRYTPTSAFDTFPWPAGELTEVAQIVVRLNDVRGEICLERNIGLTKLYNQVDDGAWKDLRELHVQLDEAVAEAYGWPRHVAHDPDESNRRLLELNRAIATGEIDYHPFEQPDARGRNVRPAP